MSRGKRNRDTSDAIDEVIAAAQDRMDQPPALPDAAEQAAQEPATNGHAPEATGHQAAPDTNGHTNGHAAEPVYKSKWLDRFGQDTQEDVGVKLAHESRNDLTTIDFPENRAITTPGNGDAIAG